mgnify:CR=1 FL=1
MVLQQERRATYIRLSSNLHMDTCAPYLMQVSHTPCTKHNRMHDIVYASQRQSGSLLNTYTAQLLNKQHVYRPACQHIKQPSTAYHDIPVLHCVAMSICTIWFGGAVMHVAISFVFFCHMHSIAHCKLVVHVWLLTATIMNCAARVAWLLLADNW